MTLSHLSTIRQIATEMQRSPRAAKRVLARAHAEDACGEHLPDWRVWDGREGSKMLFNLSRLRRAHPELFAHQPVDRMEFGQLSEEVSRLGGELRRLVRRVTVLEPKRAGWTG